MKKIWIGKICKVICGLLLPCALYGFQRPDFDHLDSLQDVTFLLSTRKSGSNWVSATLSIITRRPISWLDRGNDVFDPASKWRNHPSYNRLNLPLISEEPLLYRTHFRLSQLMRVPSQENRLIFVTRNPKELLFREFFLSNSYLENPDQAFIESFLNQYLKAFSVYASWTEENKRIVFYEDFIHQSDEILFGLLQFMKEEPKYLNEFLENKQTYMTGLLNSYKEQHKFGGSSSVRGPQEIYYSRNAKPEVLAYIDEYLKARDSAVWELYLKRFREALSL